MKPLFSKYNSRLLLLLLISFAVRALISASIDLSNDEVNYWAYALYPSLSHFDHPPMVGYIIQLFTLNLTFQSEFFVRLASVVIGTINTFLIFRIGKTIKDSQAGFYAALLYTSSVYCFFISGVFILPDTPLLLFWLLSLLVFVKILPVKNPDSYSRKFILAAGIFIGLGMLSKYTAVFIWIGALAYIVFFNRSWLKQKELYFAVLLSALVFIPVIIWNVNNNFISFTFQGDRVAVNNLSLRPDFLGTEIAGQIFYNNPVNFILAIITLTAFLRNKSEINKDYFRLLLLVSLPVIVVFLLSSLTRRTLPHWSAPGYIGLILITSYFLSNISGSKVHYAVKSALSLLGIVLLAGMLQVKTGIFFNDVKDRTPENLGEDDASLDIYGWNQLSEKFNTLYNQDLQQDRIKPSPRIYTWRWFPAANFDYYIGRSSAVYSYALGSLENIRNYNWINSKRVKPSVGDDAYYICSSRDYNLPSKFYSDYFQTIENPDTIRIVRNGINVMNYFVFRMKHLKKEL